MNNTCLSHLLGMRVLDQMTSVSGRTRHYLRCQYSSAKRMMEESDSNSDAQILPGTLGPTEPREMSGVGISPPKFCGLLKTKLTRLELGSCYIPNTNLRYHQRDSHFVCQPKDIFGVADGYVKSRRDSFVYSEALMCNALKIAKLEEPNGDDNWPSVILKKSIGLTEVEGGSTACIMALQGKEIIASKIGNSGFLVIRNDEVAYRSRLQLRLHTSNIYVGSSWPPFWRVKVSVEEGDVVVAATDGMFHNLFDDAILKITLDGKKNNLSPSIVSANLAEAARQVSLNKMCDTPFRKACRDDGVVAPSPMIGGRQDDITVIVGNVVSREVAVHGDTVYL